MAACSHTSLPAPAENRSLPCNQPECENETTHHLTASRFWRLSRQKDTTCTSSYHGFITWRVMVDSIIPKQHQPTETLTGCTNRQPVGQSKNTTLPCKCFRSVVALLTRKHGRSRPFTCRAPGIRACLIHQKRKSVRKKNVGDRQNRKKCVLFVSYRQTRKIYIYTAQKIC